MVKFYLVLSVYIIVVILNLFHRDKFIFLLVGKFLFFGRENFYFFGEREYFLFLVGGKFFIFLAGRFLFFWREYFYKLNYLGLNLF
jgi:hypothetical protein